MNFLAYFNSFQLDKLKGELNGKVKGQFGKIKYSKKQVFSAHYWRPTLKNTKWGTESKIHTEKYKFDASYLIHSWRWLLARFSRDSTWISKLEEAR